MTPNPHCTKQLQLNIKKQLIHLQLIVLVNMLRLEGKKNTSKN